MIVRYVYYFIIYLHHSLLKVLQPQYFDCEYNALSLFLNLKLTSAPLSIKYFIIFIFMFFDATDEIKSRNLSGVICINWSTIFN